MKKLIYNYELGKWRSVGLSARPAQLAVIPVPGSVKRTLDAFSIGDYAYGIINQYFEPVFLSESIVDVLGIDPDDFEIVKVLDRIPEREQEIIREFHSKALAHLTKNVLSETELLKIRFDYSYRHPKRGFRRIVQQVAPFEVRNDEVLSFLVVFTDISYLKRSGKNEYTVIDMRSGVEFGLGVRTNVPLSSPNPFSKRELDVLKCLKRGLRTEEIAEELYLSINTIYNHKKRMYKKTGVSSTVDLLIAAIQNGWIK